MDPADMVALMEERELDVFDASQSFTIRSDSLSYVATLWF